MKKEDVFYWNQSFADNLVETVMLVMTLVFLGWVIKLAFFDKDD